MSNTLNKEQVLAMLQRLVAHLNAFKSTSDSEEERDASLAYILGGLQVVNGIIDVIESGKYDDTAEQEKSGEVQDFFQKGYEHCFNPIGTQSGRLSCDSPNLSAEPKKIRTVNGHVLYTDDDFKHMSAEELELDWTAHLVLDGGLDICKVCGAGESGLDDPCKPKRNSNG